MGEPQYINSTWRMLRGHDTYFWWKIMAHFTYYYFWGFIYRYPRLLYKPTNLIRENVRQSTMGTSLTWNNHRDWWLRSKSSNSRSKIKMEQHTSNWSICLDESLDKEIKISSLMLISLVMVQNDIRNIEWIEIDTLFIWFNQLQLNI